MDVFSVPMYEYTWGGGGENKENVWRKLLWTISYTYTLWKSIEPNLHFYSEIIFILFYIL